MSEPPETATLSSSEWLFEQRERYVTRALAAPRLAVSHAEGARLTDLEGRSYVDFAGGIGCHNLGHGFAASVAAIHRQADLFLHQCAMVASYEPYVEVCRLLAELSPCCGHPQKSLLVNSGAEAVENAVKIARAATGRRGVVVFENSFHGRTHLTMAMTGKVAPYKRGFGPLASEIYRTIAPYPYRGVGVGDALAALEHLFKVEIDATDVACVVVEPVQGEGGFIVMPPEFLHGLADVCERNGIVFVADEVQSGAGRTGRVWAVEHAGVQPDLLISGKSLGGGLPLAAVTGRADLMDAPPPGGLGGTFGGNPLSCAAAVPILQALQRDGFHALADTVGTRVRERLEALARRCPRIGEVRGLGSMLAVELVIAADTREPDPALARRTIELALDRGLLLLSCGTYGNVLRILVPLVDDAATLDEGLAILESALLEAATDS